MKENRFRLARTKYNKNGPESVKSVQDATGITKSLIDDLESTVGRERGVSYQKILKLAEHYGVSVDWILGRAGSTRTLDADIASVCKYTGLSEEAVIALHDADNIEKIINAIDGDSVFIQTGERDFIDWLITNPDKLCSAIGNIQISALLDIRAPHTVDGRKIKTAVRIEMGGFDKLISFDGSRYFQREAADDFASIVSNYIEYIKSTQRHNGGSRDAVDS